MTTDEYLADCIKSAQKNAKRAERERIFKLLTSLGVMRESMLGDQWRVLYAEDGAIDITIRQLENITKQESNDEWLEQQHNLDELPPKGDDV
jgi:hypothetical protein